MAKTESAETIRRRLFILTTLSRAKVTAKIIHNKVATEGINVDRRSIQRDLKYLVDHFPNQIEVDDRDPTYGYGYRQPSHARKYSAMSPIEAICFELVKKFLDPLIPNKAIEPINAYFEEAKKVLAERQSDKYQKWSNKVQIVNEGFQLEPAKINTNIISDIYDALWDGNIIECNYQSRKATKPNKYEYHPAGIVYRGRISYLVGTFDGSPDKVIYLPLHRFKKVKIIKEKYSIHQHDRIESLTQGLFGYKLNNKNINVQLKFSPSAGAHLLETPISKKQKISHTKDGYISVKASVVDNMELRYWIRAFGHDVEVIKPISLRNDFIKMTKNLSELYEKN